jgi:hypothetical protein
MGIRRVVTGRRADGKSVFVSDEIIEPWLPPLLHGNQIYELWGDDHVPELPTTGDDPPRSGYFAPTGGYRFGFFRIPPTSFKPPPITDLQEATAETERVMPGLTTLEHPHGMHITDTVDLEMVVEGQIWLTLDSGEEKEIRTGECIIQNGTAHIWANRHQQDWCTILLVFIGAERHGY